jgi:hypothetical protein
MLTTKFESTYVIMSFDVIRNIKGKIKIKLDENQNTFLRF